MTNLVDLIAVISASSVAPESYQDLKLKLNTIRSRYQKHSNKKSEVIPKQNDK